MMIHEESPGIARKSAQIIDVWEVCLKQGARRRIKGFAETLQSARGSRHKKGRKLKSPPGSRGIVPCRTHPGKIRGVTKNINSWVDTLMEVCLKRLPMRGTLPSSGTWAIVVF